MRGAIASGDEVMRNPILGSFAVGCAPADGQNAKSKAQRARQDARAAQ